MSHLDIISNDRWLKAFDVSIDLICQKLAHALQTNDLLTMSKIFALTDTLIALKYRQINVSIKDNPESLIHLDLLRCEWIEMLSSWKDGLKVGDSFDNFHEKDKKW